MSGTKLSGLVNYYSYAMALTKRRLALLLSVSEKFNVLKKGFCVSLDNYQMMFYIKWCRFAHTPLANSEEAYETVCTKKERNGFPK